MTTSDVAPYPPNAVRYRQATPDDVEQRLYGLGNELDGITAEIQQAENDYLHAKAAYEIAYARAYIESQGSNMTIRDAHAKIQCVKERDELVRCEALVKAHKANAQRIYAHVDIARSVSVIVRAGIGAS